MVGLGVADVLAGMVDHLRTLMQLRFRPLRITKPL